VSESVAVRAALDAEHRIERDNPPAASAEEPRFGQNPAALPLAGEGFLYSF
jgi:hypothetical protein